MSHPEERVYGEDEAEEILRLAASISAPAGAINRARLVATAAELGISPEAVEIAEKRHAEDKRDRELRREFDAGQLTEFRAHLVSFLIVNSFLLIINVLTGIRDFWVIYPILGWGMGLAIHAFAVFGKYGAANAGAFERWRAAKLGIEPDPNDPYGRIYDRHEGKIIIGIHGRRHRRHMRRLRRRE